MSCQKCSDEQELVSETGVFRSAFYRWKNANIEVRGCDEHLREVFDALNKAQNEKTKE